MEFEIQRLIEERNVLEYELSVAREELYRKNFMINDIRVEHNVHCRNLMRRGLQLIDTIPDVGILKNEVKRLHQQVTKLSSPRFDVESETKAKIQSVLEKIREFCSQILHQLDKEVVHCQVLFLTPTMERAHQIEKVMQTLCGNNLDVKIQVYLDGDNIEAEKHNISTGVHLIAGTPLCVSDLLCTKNNSFNSEHIRMVVLDEADEMLSMGFDVQIHQILSLLPGKIEVIALYPIMPKDILEITRNFMNEPATSMNKWHSIIFL